MSKWLYLTLAILSEVTATSFLKSSDGFTKLWPSVIVVLGYCLAFYFLSLTLDTIPIGVAYAIWSGVETALIALVGILYYKEAATMLKFASIFLIIAGVAGHKIGSST